MKAFGIAAAIAVAFTTGSSGMAQDKPGFRDTPTLPGSQWKVMRALRRDISAALEADGVVLAAPPVVPPAPPA